MKKIKWLSMFVLAIICMTGCDSNKGSVLEQANKKMDTLKSYTANLEMNVGAKSSGVEMSVPVTMKLEMNNEKKVSKTEATISLMGMKMTVDSYTDMSGKDIITYTKNLGSDEWTKSTEQNNDAMDQLFNITEKGTKIEKKKSNDKNLEYYQITVDQKTMQEILSGSMNAVGEENSYKIKNDVIVDVYIEKKTSYITKVSMNLKDAVAMEDNSAEVTAFDLTFTFSQFNQTSVEIPKDVIENAQAESDFSDEFDFSDESDDDEIW